MIRTGWKIILLSLGALKQDVEGKDRKKMTDELSIIMLKIKDHTGCQNVL